jgi:hypothetical protein
MGDTMPSDRAPLKAIVYNALWSDQVCLGPFQSKSDSPILGTTFFVVSAIWKAITCDWLSFTKTLYYKVFLFCVPDISHLESVPAWLRQF